MSRLGLTATAAVLLLCLASVSRAFYLPGVAPMEFKENEPVELKVNKLTSTRTQMPYNYYDLRFCQPNKIKPVATNLGEVLSGDIIENSPYELFMEKNELCKVLCRIDNYTPQDMKNFMEKIDEDYRVNWIIDNLPAATKLLLENPAEPPESPHRLVPHYERGFALGFIGSNDFLNTEPGKHYINNHVRMIVRFHKDPQSFEGARIVGFEVEPFSVRHEFKGEWDSANPSLSTCTPNNNLMPMKIDDSTTAIIWTYDVQWEMDPHTKWASRWDIYLSMADDQEQIHWFSIINSMMIVLFLTGMIAMIMMRTLHRDVSRYNSAEESEEGATQEETGWKLVHGDVFRPPQNEGLLSVFVGTGAQIFMMGLVTLVFAMLGFLSPANRGGLMTALLLLFVSMGSFAGYYSARLYKMFKGVEWKKIIALTATFFPGIVFLIFFVLNLILKGERSSGAVPFSTLFLLLVLWFGISTPLVYLGAYFGFKKAQVQNPVRTNMLPRFVPQQPWYMQPLFSILVGGVLPFGAVFIELFFIMSSLWLNQYYYVFSFLFLVYIILCLTCAEITIVMCYFQLCGEDYHWWWRAYLTSGSSALYLFLYSVLYFFTKLEIIKFLSGVLFFGYMAIISLAFFHLTGTIGFVACLLFVRKIYGSIKVD